MNGSDTSKQFHATIFTKFEVVAFTENHLETV